MLGNGKGNPLSATGRRATRALPPRGCPRTALAGPTVALNRDPVIALTAQTMQGDEQKARNAGCDDYDVKPIELPRLLQKMERLLKP